MTGIPLLARWARADITPSGSWSLGGYGAREGRSSGVHAPLEANALMLEDRETGAAVAWVSIDSLAIVPPLRDAVVDAVSAAWSIDSDRIIVVASHTHSAPDAWVGTIHPSLPAQSDPGELQRIARVIADALNGAAIADPVELAWGSSTVIGVGANRHHPSGPADNSIGVLTVRSPEVSAVVIDYACHPTVLGSESVALSPDWVAAARAEIRQRFGEDLPVLYLPGSAGDVSTRFNRRAQTQGEADRLGRIVGTSAVESIEAGETLAGRGIEVNRQRFPARVRTSFDDVESAEEADAGARVAQSRSEGRRMQHAFENAGFAPSVDIETTMVRVGDRRWLHTPFEMATSLGHRITGGPGVTRHVGYSDDYAGYLVDDAAAGEGQYEARASLFDLEETHHIVDVLRSMAGQV